MRLRMFLLKHPKRLYLKHLKSQQSAAPVNIMLDSKKVEAPQNQTLLQACHKNGMKLPFQCMAGICGSCEALVNGQLTKTCYTFPKEGMRVVRRSSQMMHWRQHTGDEWPEELIIECKFAQQFKIHKVNYYESNYPSSKSNSSRIRTIQKRREPERFGCSLLWVRLLM